MTISEGALEASTVDVATRSEPPWRVAHVSFGNFQSRYFVDLAALHDRSRFEMVFASIGSVPAENYVALADAGIEVRTFGTDRVSSYPAATVRLAKWLRKERVSIVHTHLFYPSMVGLTAAKLAAVPVRILSRHHSDHSRRLDKGVHVALDRRMAVAAHRIVAQCAWQKMYLEREEELDGRTIVVNHLGIDAARAVSRDSSEVLSLQRQFELRSDQHVVVVPARLHSEKGHSDLFQALAMILKTHGNKLQVLLLGEGPHRTEIEADARHKGLDNLVRFVGFVRQPDPFFAVADLVVLPSLVETFPQVVLEAMAHGVPVIATDVGGVSEMVVERQTGFVVPPHEPKLLADRMLEVLGDASLRQGMGAAGRIRVNANFSALAMCQRNEQLYQATMLRR